MEQEIKMLKRNNKILMGILIIFILLCIGLGVYFLFIISKPSNNIVGEMTKLATEKVISQTDNLNESGLYTIVHSADSTLQIGATESVTEYRYRGANPKNYVSFNNEVWRIIGIFPTDDGTGNIENRIKLIRNESIRYYYWDLGTTAYNYDSKNDNMLLDNKDNYNVDYLEGEENYNIMMMAPSAGWVQGENNWARPATLNTYLNGNYYNTLTSEAQSMIGSSKYYLGGYNATSQTSQDMYSYERKISGSNYYYGSNPNSWVGKLALMYVSDYGYASLNCETKALYNSSDETQDLRACNDTNWLYDLYDYENYEWLLPQDSSASSDAFTINNDVGYIHITNVSVEGTSTSFRPVLYLTSNIIITSGDGTESNPYNFSL